MTVKELIEELEEEEDKQEFNRITERWFNKIVGDSWFAYGLLGVLKDDT